MVLKTRGKIKVTCCSQRKGLTVTSACDLGEMCHLGLHLLHGVMAQWMALHQQAHACTKFHRCFQLSTTVKLERVFLHPAGRLHQKVGKQNLCLLMYQFIRYVEQLPYRSLFLILGGMWILHAVRTKMYCSSHGRWHEHFPIPTCSCRGRSSHRSVWRPSFRLKFWLTVFRCGTEAADIWLLWCLNLSQQVSLYWLNDSGLGFVSAAAGLPALSFGFAFGCRASSLLLFGVNLWQQVSLHQAAGCIRTLCCWRTRHGLQNQFHRRPWLRHNSLLFRSFLHSLPHCFSEACKTESF